MEIEQILNGLQSQAANVDAIGAKIKFVLGEDAIMIDGTGSENIVSSTDLESSADCIISTSKEDFLKLKSGELNPMMAVMGGKVKIKGDMGLAMKLQSLI
ncbi:MAG TPA: SCP2 sterol-binding domain-containing protein [Saprospiraceae bacterium]|nr:SCP2 sterol-binding domain-containing protein [Saprospiraceae bacterium]